MTDRVLGVLLLVLAPSPALASAPVQDPAGPPRASASRPASPSDPDATDRIRTGRFQLDTPPDWRVLTRSEARAIADDLPYEIGETAAAGALTVYGPVDDWLRNGFTSPALVVVERRGELPVDETGLETVRTSIGRWRGEDGRRRRIDVLEPVEVGPDRHPAIFARTRTVGPDGDTLAVAEEVYAPTGGRLLILGSWSWDTAATEVSPESPPAWTRSLIFARKPHGPGRSGETLLVAIALGIVLAFFLLALRKRRSMPTGPGAAPPRSA